MDTCVTDLVAAVEPVLFLCPSSTFSFIFFAASNDKCAKTSFYIPFYCLASLIPLIHLYFIQVWEAIIQVIPGPVSYHTPSRD